MDEFEVISIPFKFSNSADIATKHQIGNLNVWVCKSDESLNVFFDECAHMGNSLVSNGEQLVCPQHGWTYNFKGRNVQTGGPNLRKAKIMSTTNSTIEVLLPSSALKLVKAKLEHPLKIDVHSHATLELNYRETSIIFDPWLEGPAYYGAWHLYPKPVVTAGNLRVDAIVITHPHPDHFHIPTLQKMDKSVPIYFPQYPSQLIEEGLAELGFSNQNPVFWGETFSIGNHFKSKFLRPRSMWEDSAAYSWIEDNGVVFNWLNLVDAGSVIDEFVIPDLDLLTSAFDQGASGYPLTWTHLSEQRKIKMLESQKKSTLKMLPSKAKKLNTTYFLPFAGHWRLGLEIHQNYAAMIPHTNFEEIADSFATNAPQSKFLGLFPGQSFDFYSKTTGTKISQEMKVDEIRADSIATAGKFSGMPTQEEISNFRMQMLSLIELGESFGCENVEFSVSISGSSYFEIFNFNSTPTLDNEKIKISVTIPSHIFNLLSEREANWDHLAIGYWGVWSRSPDIYPANFMRLLQAGNPKLENKTGLLPKSGFEFILQKTIGDIIEAEGIIAPKLFGRLGLPCLSCTRSNSETLYQALELHKIDIDSNAWILRELASRFLPKLPL
jgi:CMP-N-acetylneuraminate monooxygenase